MGEPTLPTPETIDRLHVICVSCKIDCILGHKIMEPHFGERTHLMLTSLLMGDANFKCSACASRDKDGLPEALR